MKVGINGMGRIGRLALRAAMGAAHRPADDPRQANRLDVVHLNELKGGAAATAHLLAFDSIQGQWRAEIGAHEAHAVQINQQSISFSTHAAPADIPWGDLGVELVLECTGKFLTPETLQGHFDRGAKRVIVAAPVKEPDVLNVVVGVNHHLYDPAIHPIVTAASCTTNAICPILKTIHDGFGIDKGHIETVHAYTNDQNLLDNMHKKERRGRAAAVNMVITSTGAGNAVTKVIPDLQDKLTANAVRVPTPNGSLAILSLELNKETSVEHMNSVIKNAALNGELVNQIFYSFDPELVSSDIIGNTCCSVYDSNATIVSKNGKNIVLYTWYDNEFGYTKQVIRLAKYISKVRRAIYY